MERPWHTKFDSTFSDRNRRRTRLSYAFFPLRVGSNFGETFLRGMTRLPFFLSFVSSRCYCHSITGAFDDLRCNNTVEEKRVYPRPRFVTGVSDLELRIRKPNILAEKEEPLTQSPFLCRTTKVRQTGFVFANETKTKSAVSNFEMQAKIEHKPLAKIHPSNTRLTRRRPQDSVEASVFPRPSVLFC